MGDNTLEKRCVVLTRESIFYVPEDHSTPLATLSTPQKANSGQSNGSRSPSKAVTADSEEDVAKYSSTFQVFQTYGLCFLVLVLLIAMLVAAFLYRRESFALNVGFALVGVWLGYVIALAQKTKCSVEGRNYDD